MTPENFDLIGQAALGLGVLAGGIWTGVQATRAKREAARAASHAYPVSNGWGSKVAGDLSYLREAMDRLHDRQDAADRRQTAADEQRADLGRRIEGAAAHARTAAEQSATVAAGLATHLADHASTDAQQRSPLEVTRR